MSILADFQFSTSLLNTRMLYLKTSLKVKTGVQDLQKSVDFSVQEIIETKTSKILGFIFKSSQRTVAIQF